MNKIVTRINWVNDTDPAINDTHLNQMDSELDAIDDRVISMETDVIQQAENAEAWANGTRGGEAIDPSDPAYHKDAKYQAGQAASSASAAATSETNAGGSASAAGSSATAASGSANTASQKALDAEAWANGTRGGEAIGPSDPAYQKYSKWWAEHGANSLAGLTDVNITSPQDGDTLVYDSVTQKWINVAVGPTPVTVTLTLNGAKNDVITVKDSNNQTVGTCTFAAGQTSGTVQIDVPVGGGTFKFISSVSKVKSGGSFVDYEKTVTLSDALSQTVNVYPKNAFSWYGNDINNITHDGYSWDGATTYAANKGTNYVEFTQSNFQLMGTANAIDFTPFSALHFIIESNVSINTTGGGLNTTKTSISAGGNLSKYADFPGSNNAKADVELDVTSINQSAYIFMVDGSNTAHSCKVYAIFGDDGHEDDITIHGAKEDAITIKDTDDQTVATCIFGSGQTVGYVSKNLLPSGTYKFISSVAKATDGSGTDYEKTIVLDGSESEIYVMPTDGAGNLDKTYCPWYGNRQIYLPNTFTAHEYIGTSGTQYFDTGVTPTSPASAEVEADIMSDSSVAYLLATVGNGNRAYFLGVAAANRMIIGYNTTSVSGGAPVNFTVGQTYKWKTELKNGDQKYYKDGVVFYSNTVSGDLNVNNTLALNALHEDATYRLFGSAKYRSVKIILNDNMVRNFVPCSRIADSVVGMYDVINDVFYTNAGTGSFTYG